MRLINSPLTIKGVLAMRAAIIALMLMIGSQAGADETFTSKFLAFECGDQPNTFPLLLREDTEGWSTIALLQKNSEKLERLDEFTFVFPPSNFSDTYLKFKKDKWQLISLDRGDMAIETCLEKKVFFQLMAAAAVQEFGSNDYAAEKIKELKLLYEGIKAQNVEAKAQIENLQLEVAGTIATNIIMVEKHSKLEKLYHTAKEDTKHLLLVKPKKSCSEDDDLKICSDSQMSEKQAKVRYAATGIWMKAPSVPYFAATVSASVDFYSSMDSEILSQTAVALPKIPEFRNDLIPNKQSIPPRFGQTLRDWKKPTKN